MSEKLSRTVEEDGPVFHVSVCVFFVSLLIFLFDASSLLKAFLMEYIFEQTLSVLQI